MKIFFLALLLFLLAFCGLSIGLIVRRRGLRGTCNSNVSSGRDCRCETELDSSMRGQQDCQGNKQLNRDK